MDGIRDIVNERTVVFRCALDKSITFTTIMFRTENISGALLATISLSYELPGCA